VASESVLLVASFVNQICVNYNSYDDQQIKRKCYFGPQFCRIQSMVSCACFFGSVVAQYLMVEEAHSHHGAQNMKIKREREDARVPLSYSMTHFQ
jgi:hypothetical protein